MIVMISALLRHYLSLFDYDSHNTKHTFKILNQLSVTTIRKNMTIKERLFLKDNNSVLGAIRISCSIIGGLLISYLLLMLLATYLTNTIFENIVLMVYRITYILGYFWILDNYVPNKIQ